MWRDDRLARQRDGQQLRRRVMFADQLKPAGQPVGGKIHTPKAQGYIKALERWLQKHPTAASGDRAAAENEHCQHNGFEIHCIPSNSW